MIVGRIRKDARLFKVPEQPVGRACGRKKYYGDSLPTPEEVRQDESIPWQKVKAFAAGKYHEFEIKTMTPVRWKSSKNKDMLVVIVRPLAYRPRNGARLLYRNPAYLICTDPALPLEQILQSYVWRWEAEVNFRDEKTVLGVGEAQVRTEPAVRTAPAFCVAVYSMLLLAAHMAKIDPSCLPATKWNKALPNQRLSTQKIIALFRANYWNIAPKNKSGFVPPQSGSSEYVQNRFFTLQALISACCYALK
ncbi:MAG: hypothetical protein LBS10_01385 [Gracilibacteraceae bacterium]|nr:hypothetical protein [Gracilibacteraceae bacterium]